MAVGAVASAYTDGGLARLLGRPTMPLVEGLRSLDWKRFGGYRLQSFSTTGCDPSPHPSKIWIRAWVAGIG